MDTFNLASLQNHFPSSCLDFYKKQVLTCSHKTSNPDCHKTEAETQITMTKECQKKKHLETQENSFIIGSANDKNKKCRKTMEDTHEYIYNFGGVADQGYFAIFDGHAGNQAANFCKEQFHVILYDLLCNMPSSTIPDIFNATFSSVDDALANLPSRNSGCTAITALIRWEERSFTTISGLHEIRRTKLLYTANVGDARAVLCRGGKAHRLSYDHKSSDWHESQRIINAGGVIINNRVNGILAVTRALGDTYMKNFVISRPFTTETILIPNEDEFVILACDGLWDVCTDQQAVDICRNIYDPNVASRKLIDYAISQSSTDNITTMVIRLFKNSEIKECLF
ncbi:unnamed protein product [Pneumocystis jirovecii]|uniref:PPM-type phosphatase domain-containing protein n=2 Tax=Pneumocystis jirovecii TaxID=42068 RepID=L0P913_PNEJI|nr:uncharacterized protein T551_00195 [Pneumocystis jirovecii RU7]KTW32710.1 hypothetical protein T551_00195 [Pneumocystis jirovecii RU7]CCJ28712.1 unnamed protein product [Pneumocystis jirovecii]